MRAALLWRSYTLSVNDKKYSADFITMGARAYVWREEWIENTLVTDLYHGKLNILLRTPFAFHAYTIAGFADL